MVLLELDMEQGRRTFIGNTILSNIAGNRRTHPGETVRLVEDQIAQSCYDDFDRFREIECRCRLTVFSRLYIVTLENPSYYRRCQ